MQTKYLNRCEELEADIAKHFFASRQHNTRKRIENGDWQKWATSAQHLIESTFGSSSAQARNFLDCYRKCDGLESEVRSLHAIYRSASEDFKAGFAGNIGLRISGEVLAILLHLQSSHSQRDIRMLQ